MLVEKDSLIIYLLESLYAIILKIDDEKGNDYVKGYIKGFKDCIEEVNKYNKKGGV